MRGRSVPELSQVGIIGCGTVGRTLAARLLRHGRVPQVYDQDPARTAQVVDAGGIAANTAHELAEQVDCLISALPRAVDVEGVFLGPAGVLAAMKPRSMVLESSTVGPECVRTVADEAKRKKIRYLDTPLARGAVVDHQATLTVLVGGNADHFDLARPVLELLADKLLYCGGVGQAQVVKLINNLLTHIITVAAGEALALGVRSGLSLDLICSALNSGTAQNRVVDELLPGSAFQGDWSPGHRIDMGVKELEEVDRLAAMEGVSQSLLEPVLRLFRLADDKGWGDLSVHAVLRMVEEQAGVRLRSETDQGD